MATKLELEAQILELKRKKGLLEAQLETAKENNERMAKEKQVKESLLRFIVGASDMLASPQKEIIVDPLDKKLTEPDRSDLSEEFFQSLWELLEGLDEEAEAKLHVLGARLSGIKRERSLVDSIFEQFDLFVQGSTPLSTRDQLFSIKKKMEEMKEDLLVAYHSRTVNELIKTRLITVANGK